MLDIKFIREHKDAVVTAAKNKHITIDLDRLLELDDERRKLQKRVDDLKASQGQANDEMASASTEQKQSKLMLLRKLAGEVKDLERIFSGIDSDFRLQLLTIPNIPDARVPIGNGEADNVELKKVGEIPQFDFEIKDHLTLGKELDIIDTERGIKVTGSRGYYLKGAGAQLEMALMMYGLDFLRARGFTQFMTPLMTYPEFFYGTAYFPWGQDETFKVSDKEKIQHLIGSSEITLCAYHANETLQDSDLPKRYTAWTPCFRTEVGSYGKDTKGLYRLRQFSKVEQVLLAKNDDVESMKLFEEIIKNSEDFLTSLGLSYRVMELCTAEMGAPQRYKRDIETWMPSRERYSETHSCSFIGEFQARRLNMRYKTPDGKIFYCHTLNNTLVASPRVLIPLLECNQQADGSIKIPEVLQKYMNGQSVITRP